MNINGVDISKQLLWKQMNIFMTLFLLEITEVYVVKQLKDITSQNAYHPFITPFTYQLHISVNSHYIQSLTLGIYVEKTNK